MEKKIIKHRYDTLISLGFEYKLLGDQLYIDQYGYHWFLVQFKLGSGIMLDWNIQTQQIDLKRWNKGGGGSLLATIENLSEDDIKMYIEFFKGTRERDH